VAYLLLNTSFETVADIDNYDSMIWTDRYYACGDFSLYLAASTAAVATYVKDYYIWTDESNELMIVETSEIKESQDGGEFLTVTGRSVTSILDRRIIWGQVTLQGNFQTAIKKLMNENAINPTDASRKIPGLTFKDSTDPAITGLTIDEQFLGTNLYSTIAALCKIRNVGFRITGTEGAFVFELYMGKDRSFNQLANPQISFSPDMDNLTSSRYLHSKETLRTLSLVGGEGEWPSKTFAVTTVSAGAGSGLNRRELYTESGTSSKNGDVQLTPEEYNNLLIEKGRFDLLNNRETMTFDGEIEMTDSHEYNVDFFMGDILQMANEYGIESTSRVVEFIRSKSPTGTAAYPTLESVTL
jgi:hypothetical protein